MPDCTMLQLSKDSIEASTLVGLLVRSP